MKEELTVEEYRRRADAWRVTYVDARQIFEALSDRLGETKDEFLGTGGPEELLGKLLSAYNDLENEYGYLRAVLGHRGGHARRGSADAEELREWKERAQGLCLSFLRIKNAAAEELAAAINGGDWVVGQKLIQGLPMTEEDKEYLADKLSE